jgi:hypothetical protein
MTEEEQTRYSARFFAAATPEALLALGRELACDYPDDTFALSLGEMVANAVAIERPELLDDH